MNQSNEAWRPLLSMRKIKREGFSPSSAPGFKVAFCFIDSGKIRKKNENFKERYREKSLTRRHRVHGGSGYVQII